ncbi:hypothetical protein QBC45DRAFT_380112 [Copromyces sp. CBS 386.78]|nr:hypothetical protein QBC45DRAFT_380112 [Copromyces sp. CBS 386.78]
MAAPQQNPPGLALLTDHHNFGAWNSSLWQYLWAQGLMHYLVLDEMPAPDVDDCRYCYEAIWHQDEGRVLCLLELTALNNHHIRAALQEHNWIEDHTSPKYHYEMIVRVFGPVAPV